MEHNYDDIILLERYLERSLNEAEVRDLERRLAEEPTLRELYQNEKLLVNGIRYGHLKTQLEHLNDLETKLGAVPGDEKPGRIINLRTYWKPLAAAASFLLIASWIFIFGPEKTPLNERLYIAYFEPFDSPGSGLTRSDNNLELTWKAKAYEAYDKDDYRQAVGLFENALQENEDPVVILCLGNAYLATGQPEKAEVMFSRILAQHQDLVTQAKWYLSLAYLRQNKLERSKAILWEISKSSTYGEKARKLLKELN